MTTRTNPAGPPARTVRGRPGGIGRSSTPTGEAVSDALRRGASANLRRRRGIAALAIAANAALSTVALYQTGLIRRLPEPPLDVLDAESVDASGEAYAVLATPDAALAMASYAVTLALAAMGDDDRARERPWLPLLAALKVAGDAGGAVFLFVEQLSKHRKLCSWCTVAAAASVAAVPLAVPEAREALRTLLR